MSASNIASNFPPDVDSVFAEREFLRSFEDLTFPSENSHHREHIHLAWLYLQQNDTQQATNRMVESIRRFATVHGAPEKVHATLTYVWVRLVAAALRRSPGLSFSWFTAANPELLDKDLPHRYYTQAMLDSHEARRQPVDPDLAPLP